MLEGPGRETTGQASTLRQVFLHADSIDVVRGERWDESTKYRDRRDVKRSLHRVAMAAKRR